MTFDFLWERRAFLPFFSRRVTAPWRAGRFWRNNAKHGQGATWGENKTANIIVGWTPGPSVTAGSGGWQTTGAVLTAPPTGCSRSGLPWWQHQKHWHVIIIIIIIIIITVISGEPGFAYVDFNKVNNKIKWHLSCWPQYVYINIVTHVRQILRNTTIQLVTVSVSLHASKA